MESNWRRGAYRIGWNIPQIRLCSRLVGIPFYNLTDWSTIPGFANVIIGNPLDPDSFFPLFLGSLFKFSPHFPYGYNVEPDSPP